MHSNTAYDQNKLIRERMLDLSRRCCNIQTITIIQTNSVNALQDRIWSRQANSRPQSRAREFDHSTQLDKCTSRLHFMMTATSSLVNLARCDQKTLSCTYDAIIRTNLSRNFLVFARHQLQVVHAKNLILPRFHRSTSKQGQYVSGTPQRRAGD